MGKSLVPVVFAAATVVEVKAVVASQILAVFAVEETLLLEALATVTVKDFQMHLVFATMATPLEQSLIAVVFATVRVTMEEFQFPVAFAAVNAIATVNDFSMQRVFVATAVLKAKVTVTIPDFQIPVVFPATAMATMTIPDFQIPLLPAAVRGMVRDSLMPA